MASVQGSDLAPVFGDVSQSEKVSEIKLPLDTLQYNYGFFSAGGKVVNSNVYFANILLNSLYRYTFASQNEPTSDAIQGI